MEMTNRDNLDPKKAMQAMNCFYGTQVGICIAALSKLRSAELADKNIILRVIMCDMPDCDGITAEDYSVDFWADRAEYVDDTSFNLYVTQAEENVLWNIAKKGQKPGRQAVPQQRITVRTDGISSSPHIPLIYLTVLSSKLLAMAIPNVLPAEELTAYYDERVMAVLWERIVGTLDHIAELQNGKNDAGSPAC